MVMLSLKDPIRLVFSLYAGNIFSYWLKLRKHSLNLIVFIKMCENNTVLMLCTDDSAIW